MPNSPKHNNSNQSLLNKTTDELITIINELNEVIKTQEKQLEVINNDNNHTKNLLKTISRFPDESPEPIIRVDLEGNIIYKNAASEEVLERVLLKENISIRNAINEAIAAAFKDNTTLILELDFDGLIYKLYIKPFKDTKDANLYFSDISKRKKIERELVGQKGFYESTLNTLPSDVIVLDKNFKFLFANPAAIKSKDVREWVIGKDDFEYCKYRNRDIKIAEERRERYLQAINKKAEIEWEEAFKLEDGSEKHHLRRVNPVFDEEGNLKYLIGYGVDITQLKLAERRIIESEKQTSDLINYTQAAICTHDLEGTLISANPALEAISEYSAEELIGNKLEDFVPEEYIRYYNLYLRRINRHSTANGIMTIQSKSGKVMHLMYRNYKMEEEGKPTYVIGFAQDVTERLLAEQELKEAKQIAEQALKVRELFLANISHEIRTPMNGILGLIDILSQTTLDATQHKYVDVIKKSASNLLILLNDVLDVAKIDSGRMEFESIPFNLKETLTNALQSVIYNANERGNTVFDELNIADDLVLIGDPYRLNQILLNLLNNANKFTEAGKVVLKASVLNETEEQVTIQISVKDTGIGISEEAQKNVFKEFTQANAGTTRKYGGTGLGLTICKKLVEIQNGKIYLNSKEGEGSEFFVELTFNKVLGDDTIETEITHEKMEASLKGLEVLVAEDNEINRFLAKTVLENWGAQVTTVNNGKEAVEVVKEKLYSIILMDIQMPEMNGLEATRAIRDIEDSTKASIPIIALTANALKGEEDKCKEMGMDEYLAKPFDQTILYNKIVKLTKTKPVQMEEKNNSNVMFDLTKLDKHVQGNPEFKKRMVSLFIDNAGNDIVNMDKAIEEQNWEVLKRIAHKLKPSLDIIGAEGVRKLALDVEAFIPDSSNKETGYTKVEKFKTNLMSLVSQLKEHQNV